ncbi:MAG: DUF3526 domain-containing protein, partial [Pseudomonadota bacterium]
MTFLLMGLSLLPALLSQSLEAQAGRLLWLAVAYSLMLSAFALTVLWLSARSHTVTRAFIASAFAWFTLALILPAMSGQLAVSLFPDPDAQSINAAIERDAIAAFREGDAREKAMAALEADIVADQGGIAFDDLGYSRVALSLQAHEEFANDVYDALYGELYDNHRRQDSVMRYAALLSPVLAAQRLSSALAGTDLTAQISFAEQAEAHRRLIIADLNMDMMVNGGANAYAYRADRTLWEATQEFIPRPPSVTAILSAYRIEWLSLLLWFAVMTVLSVRATQRAMTAEAQ